MVERDGEADESIESSAPESEAGPTSDPSPAVVRTEKGTFQKGVSGNPKGRAKGSKNAITLRRLETEEALRDYLAPRAKGLLKKAMQMAMSGDTKMMSVLLDKMLSSLRNEDVGDQKDTNVNVTFTNLTQVARDRVKPVDFVEGEIVQSGVHPAALIESPTVRITQTPDSLNSNSRKT